MNSKYHWTNQTSFWAYSEIMKYFVEQNYIENIDSKYTDINSYKFKLYENYVLGSSGKRTGKYFAGVEDFYLVIPKFNTDITLEIPNIHVFNSGSFENVAYDMKSLVLNYFNSSCHGIIGYGGNPYTMWRNQNAPIDKNILVIGDSFSNLPFSLMSMSFKSVDEYNVRYKLEKEFLISYNEYDPDIVVMLIYPPSLTTEIISYKYLEIETESKK